MRKIDFFELMDFVKVKQAFSLRWMDRYYLMARLYETKRRLVRDQMDRLRGDDFWVPESLWPQWDAMEAELQRVEKKKEYCWQKHSVLMRYGQYFGQLPFRLLDKNGKIPDCFWYVPEPEAQTPPKDGSQNH